MIPRLGRFFTTDVSGGSVCGSSGLLLALERIVFLGFTLAQADERYLPPGPKFFSVAQLLQPEDGKPNYRTLKLLNAGSTRKHQEAQETDSHKDPPSETRDPPSV